MSFNGQVQVCGVDACGQHMCWRAEDDVCALEGVALVYGCSV